MKKLLILSTLALLLVAAPALAATINGTAGGDVLIGTNGPDTINGNGGGDFIDGKNGPDTITFSHGSIVFGGNGPDVITQILAGGAFVDCGAGQDVATVSANSITVNCETVHILGAPTPTPTPTPEPTVEPTPTPEPTIEPTPSVEPTPEPTIEPSPTVEPTPEPSPEPSAAPAVNGNGGGSDQGPGGDCEKSTDPGACTGNHTNTVLIKITDHFGNVFKKWFTFVATCKANDSKWNWKGVAYCDNQL